MTPPLTNTQLKSKLRDLGLPTTGNKIDLILRLRAGEKGLSNPPTPIDTDKLTDIRTRNLFAVEVSSSIQNITTEQELHTAEHVISEILKPLLSVIEDLFRPNNINWQTMLHLVKRFYQDSLSQTDKYAQPIRDEIERLKSLIGEYQTRQYQIARQRDLDSITRHHQALEAEIVSRSSRGDDEIATQLVPLLDAKPDIEPPQPLRGNSTITRMIPDREAIAHMVDLKGPSAEELIGGIVVEAKYVYRIVDEKRIKPEYMKPSVRIS